MTNIIGGYCLESSKMFNLCLTFCTMYVVYLYRFLIFCNPLFRSIEVYTLGNCSFKKGKFDEKMEESLHWSMFAAVKIFISQSWYFLPRAKFTQPRG